MEKLHNFYKKLRYKKLGLLNQSFTNISPFPKKYSNDLSHFLLNFSAGIFAVLVPDFRTVLSLIGSLRGTIFSTIFPAVFYIWVKKRRLSKLNRLCRILIVVMGAF